MFEAVILAGGMGTRLKTITGDLPKPMVDVSGRPFLYRLMENLESAGCSRIVLSIGYRADYIKKRVKEDLPVSCNIEFAVEDKPLGTGGGIKKAAKLIQSEKFLVLNGDSYCDLKFHDFIQFSGNKKLVIAGVEVPDASRYGLLELKEDGRVVQFLEKTNSGRGIINSGIYSVSRAAILAFEQDYFSFENDFVKKESQTLYAFIHSGYFVDIGIPEDYLRACEYFR